MQVSSNTQSSYSFIILFIFLGPYMGSSAQFFGYSGAAIALVFANVGAAYGTAKSSIGIANLGMVD